MTVGKERIFKVFLTRSGDKVKGKKLALKYVIDNRYSQSEITLVRNSLREDGWQSSERMPENWFFRIDNKSNFTCISPNGIFYKSKGKAMQYLKSQNLTEDANMISNFVK